jgi:hypothetical protein
LAGGSGSQSGDELAANYILGVGVGGTVSGGNGEVVITWTSAVLTATTLSVKNASGTFGQTVTLTATLTNTSTTTGIPNETVTFTVGGVSAGSGTTDTNGNVSASFTIPTSLAAGANTITASFGGDSTYAATSGTGTLTVAQGATNLAVPNVSGSPGQSVTLSATLTRTADSAVVPGETVSFTVNGVSAGSGVTNSSGVASVSYTVPSSMAAGPYPIVATFAGDSTYLATTGNATLTVTSSSTVTISGVVTLQGSVNEAQSITFTIQPTSNLSSMTTQTVTLSSSGAYTLTGITPGTYNIAAKGDRWLQAVVLNVNATSAASGVDLTLIPGDLNGDNQISLADLLLLLKAYGSTPSSSNWNPVADLNCDGQVSLTDLLLLLKNYGKLGQNLPSS